jgi:hypothetical protein
MDYLISFQINLDTNQFETDINEGDCRNPTSYPPNKASKPYFYFYIQGHCHQCGLSSAYSIDLELDMFSKKIHNIGLEGDNFIIADGNHRLCIETYYDTNTMSLNLDKLPLTNSEFQKIIQLPMINLDFSDPAKLIKKIKLLILFS